MFSVTSEHIRLCFLVSLFYTVVGSAHVKIASRIVTRVISEPCEHLKSYRDEPDSD